MLGIDQSRARLDRLESLLGTRCEFVPRRREDIQFIFAPAPAGIERQLQPQLRFFYAGGIPTYATSDAFEPDPRANQDLDGLMFPAMPWMLGSPLAEAVRSAASQAWPAGGPDARPPLRLRVRRLSVWPRRCARARRASSLDISGLTGQLTLEPDGRDPSPARLGAASRRRGHRAADGAGRLSRHRLDRRPWRAPGTARGT